MPPFHASSLKRRLIPGAYLTDEEHLYRVLRVVGGTVALEDCFSDQLASRTVAEALALRTVTPTQGAAP